MDRTKKYYCFAFILYRDSTIYDYDSILDYIRQNWTTYAYIEHSPELDENKYHTHVLVQFPNKRYIQAISKEIGLESNYIQPVHLLPYLRYLIHFDDEEKIQYSPYDVHGTLQPKLLGLIQSSTTDSEKAESIFQYICNFKGWITIVDVSQYVYTNGLYDSFRRNYIYFKDLISDHNKLF